MNDRFVNWVRPEIKHSEPTIYGWTVFHPKNFTMGKNIDIGAMSHIFCHHGVDIGDDVQIGGCVFIYSLSTIDNKRGKVTIKKGAKIGALTIIMPGVTIGENALVGAHSFVNEDVSDNGVVYGVPARQRPKKGK